MEIFSSQYLWLLLRCVQSGSKARNILSQVSTSTHTDPTLLDQPEWVELLLKIAFDTASDSAIGTLLALRVLRLTRLVLQCRCLMQATGKV